MVRTHHLIDAVPVDLTGRVFDARSGAANIGVTGKVGERSHQTQDTVSIGGVRRGPESPAIYSKPKQADQAQSSPLSSPAEAAFKEVALTADFNHSQSQARSAKASELFQTVQSTSISAMHAPLIDVYA